MCLTIRQDQGEGKVLYRWFSGRSVGVFICPLPPLRHRRKPPLLPLPSVPLSLPSTPMERDCPEVLNEDFLFCLLDLVEREGEAGKEEAAAERAVRVLLAFNLHPPPCTELSLVGALERRSSSKHFLPNSPPPPQQQRFPPFSTLTRTKSNKKGKQVSTWDPNFCTVYSALTGKVDFGSMGSCYTLAVSLMGWETVY